MDMLDLQTYGIIQIKSIEKKREKYNVKLWKGDNNKYIISKSHMDNFSHPKMTRKMSIG